jgi:hypothetical protein
MAFSSSRIHTPLLDEQRIYLHDSHEWELGEECDTFSKRWIEQETLLQRLMFLASEQVAENALESCLSGRKTLKSLLGKILGNTRRMIR